MLVITETREPPPLRSQIRQSRAESPERLRTDLTYIYCEASSEET